VLKKKSPKRQLTEAKEEKSTHSPVAAVETETPPDSRTSKRLTQNFFI
jgi:hypothetical protein